MRNSNYNKIKFRDCGYEIGDVVLCVYNDYEAEDHLIVGQEYIIEDLEWRFPYSICVKSSYSGAYLFLDCSYFDGKTAIRNKKIETIIG